jgi:hypothetical protein
MQSERSGTRGTYEGQTEKMDLCGPQAPGDGESGCGWEDQETLTFAAMVGTGSPPPPRSAPPGSRLTIGGLNAVSSCLPESCKNPHGDVQDQAGLVPALPPSGPRVLCACAPQGLLENVVQGQALSPQNCDTACS